MKNDERLRRPTLARTKPMRKWSTLFRQSNSWSPEMSEESPHNKNSSNGATAPESVMARAVELAYAVSEEQIQMAKRVAEQVSDGKLNSEEITGNLSEVVERLRHFYSDLGALWFETLESVFRNQSFGDWLTNMSAETSERFDEFTGEYISGGSRPSSGRTQPANIPVEIISPEPTNAQVKVELHRDIGQAELIVMPLCTRDSEAAPLAQTKFVQAQVDWPLTLQIMIPAGQAAGSYSGLIINTITEEPWGTVCIQIPIRNDSPGG